MSLDAAIEAAKRGMYVHPLDHPSLPTCVGVGRGHDPDTCTERGKHPTTKWGVWATIDLEAIYAEWSGHPRNVGIACGKSGIVVIDEDKPGEFERYADDHGHTLVDTYIVQTGKGCHWYFQALRGVPIGNAEGMFAGYAINVRGGPTRTSEFGGYVVAAGSTHQNGVVYEAENDLDPAPMPTWLIDLTGNDQPFTTVSGPFELPDVITSTITDGPPSRDDVLYRYACSLQARHATKIEALTNMQHLAFPRVEQPDGHLYPLSKALGKVEAVYAQYGDAYISPNGKAAAPASADPLGTVSLGDAPGEPPEALTAKGLPVWAGLVHVVAGAGESCKSLIAASVAANVIRAGHSVLILDGEMSRRAWEARILELGLTRVELLRYVRYAEITALAADVAAVRATVAHWGIRLVIWDSALSVISRTARSENDNAEVARVYDRIRDICRDGPAGLIVDHVAAGAGTMISRGATAKFNAVDVAYGVRLTDGSVPNLTDQWSARITIEKDRHGMFEKRADREATFIPLGNRFLEIDVVELDRASHRLTTVGKVDLVAKIAALTPPATSGNDAFKKIGGNRKAVLAAWKAWGMENQ